MILSDTKIREYLNSWELKVDSMLDYDIDKQIWPASLDFRLGWTFKIYRKSRQTVIDSKVWIEKEHVETIKLQKWDMFVLHPWDFVLWATVENIRVPYDLVARCEWRSSLWRLWIIIHSTAGFIDPWFSWTITLEMTNINEVPVALYVWDRVWQFAFELISGDVENTYDKRLWSKYMGQIDPEESRKSNDLY